MSLPYRGMALEEGISCPHCPASSRRTYKSLPMHVYQRHPEKAGLSVVLSYTDPFHRPQVTTVLKTQLSKDGDLWVWRCPGYYCDKYFTKKGDLTDHWREVHEGSEVSSRVRKRREVKRLPSEEDELDDDDNAANDVDHPGTRQTTRERPPQAVKSSISAVVAAQSPRGSRSQARPQKPQKYVIEFLESISNPTSASSGPSHNYVQYASVFEGLGMETREDFETMIKYGPEFVDQIGMELRKAGLLPFRWFVIKEELRQQFGDSRE